MSEQEKKSDVDTDREAALNQWEKQSHQSMVADARKKKLNGIGLAVFAAAAIGAVWLLKHGGSGDGQQKPADATDVTIADRKPVPKLKPDAGGTPAVAKDTPPKQAENDLLRAQREQLELARQEAERKLREARLKSSIIATGGQAGGGATSSGPAQSSTDARPQLNNSGEPVGAQDANSRFARAVSGQDVPASSANQVTNLEYKVLQGKVIEAVLEPRATSDLPGMVCATVQHDVYGSEGRIALIPWGSRMCGRYSAEMRKGQSRLFVIWNTLRRPDGVQVTLDSIGADQIGTAGMGGYVDNHFAQIFGVSALLSIVGAGASNIGVTSTDRNNSASYYRESVQSAAANTANQVLQPYANIPPTVVVPAGSRIRVYANRDLDFSSIYQAELRRIAQRQGITQIW